MIAVIGGSDRVASITLHHKLGFQQVGLLRNIGLKNGHWLDCVYMQRALGAGHETVPQS
jgi:phosphinothricin acetyltransferase